MQGTTPLTHLLPMVSTEGRIFVLCGSANPPPGELLTLPALQAPARSADLAQEPDQAVLRSA